MSMNFKSYNIRSIGKTNDPPPTQKIIITIIMIIIIMKKRLYFWQHVGKIEYLNIETWIF